MTYENGVLHIIKGDDEVLKVEITDSEGQPYEMQTGDTLTLTVREVPDIDSTEIICVTSETDEITISHDDSGDVSPGFYSADVQLTFADGTRKTVWNGVTASNHGKVTNWKNFCVDAEVSE